ncbi:MAG TPA: C25 family cysteine peptidase [Candidatus Sumerlaeota bacterium]|nr:MAG: Gingipain R1 precursor [candidate division BRC1 bacterium ADurb.Bin183]HOE63180.1 C25 family cysteine peptidase [Candidatus Sumerlaeota bacterium]HON50538.1 C25 family cysteine peptidase [Candidatus Sumerlaeota bacterium]HOR65360.1 C25 family cysteine peptidase [Candidatus Sumerlaeota bacterium]HRU54345.1 C25 family cysteine peptidase [Candidatus Sumerlaeia bacterium]
MKRIAFMFWLGSIIFITGTLFAAMPATSEEAAYQNNIKGHIVSFSENEIVLSVVNEIPEGNPPPENVKQKKRFLLIIPENSGVTMEVLSAGFARFEKNILVEEAKWGEKKSYNLPEKNEILTYEPYGIFRSWKMASLEITTVFPMTSAQDLNLRLTNISISIRFTNPAISDANFSDPLGENLLKSAVLNYECRKMWRLAPPELEQEFAPYQSFAARVNDSLSSAPAAKLTVYRSGLYGVSAAEMKAAGIDVAKLSPARLSLYHNGRQIPIFLEESSGQFFDTGGKFYFYAPPTPEPVIHDTYWLLYSEDASSTGALRIKREVVTSEREVKGDIFNADQRTSFFPFVNYFHKLPTPHFNGNWFWDEIRRGEFRYYHREILAPDTDAKEYTLQVHVAGPQLRMKNYCEVYWNQMYLGTCDWTGSQNYTFTQKLPIATLKDGENELALYIPLRAEKEQSPHINFIGFEVDYTARLSNDHAPFSFTVPAPEQPGWHRLWFSQPPMQSYFLFDVTDDYNPRLYTVHTSLHPERKEYNYSTLVDIPSERRLILGSWAKAESVGKITPVNPLNLLDGEEGDYVIISHHELMDAMKPFVAIKEKKGFKPLLVDVDDIYDSFSFGAKDFNAIKRFFRFRYYQAKGALLRYGLLVGETSDYVGDPANMPKGVFMDMVPVYNLGTPFTNIHSDSEYALICGNDDIPDFSLGRFPARTAEEVADLIAKAESYEGRLPAGEWRITNAFVTDDEAEFSQIAESLISNLFPVDARILRIFQKNYDYSDLLFIWYRKTSIKARKELIKAMNDGALTINYVGHGGPNLWTSERLFHINDLDALKNSDKLFFLTASTCDTSWLDYPTPPVNRSLGERLTLLPDAGAIAVYAPTTGASPSDHKILMWMLYNGIFNKGIRNIGEAVIFSKIGYRFERSNKYLLDQFILLGDPSLFLPMDLPATELSVEPIFINRREGGKVEMKGRIKNQPRWGLTKIFIQPPNSDPMPLEIKTHASDGSFTAEYFVPPFADAGKYGVSALTYNSFLGEQEHGGGFFYVDQPRFNMIMDVNPERPGDIYENEKVIVSSTVQNTSPFPLENIQIRLRQKTIKTPIFEKNISLSPRQGVKYDLAWLAEAGVHQLILEAWLPGQNEEDWNRREKFVSVISRKAMNRAEINMDEIKTRPEILIDGVKPEFIVPVHNIGKMAFYQLALTLKVGGSVIGSPKTISYLNTGQRIEIAYPTDASFPTGNIPLEVSLEAFNQQTQQFDRIKTDNRVFNVGTLVDLVTLPDSVTFESEGFLTGQTIFINAVVKNNGTRVAENVLVQAFVNRPWVASALARPFFSGEGERIKELRPGQEKKVRLRWDPIGVNGKHNIYVIANSTRAIPEKQYENNVAFAEVEIFPHTNIAISSKDLVLSRNILRKGDKTDVRFIVRNDSTKPAGAFDILFQDYGINQRPEPIGAEIRVIGVNPGDALPLKFAWIYRAGRNKLRIDLNHSHMIQEENSADNTAEATLYVIENLKNLPKTGNNIYSYQNNLMDGVRREAEITPLREIRSTGFEDATGVVFDVEKQYVREGAPEANPELPEKRDNQWTLKPGWLASSPDENAPPITLAFPIPSDSKTTMYDVYIHVQTIADLDGFPSSKLRIKVENEERFQTQDWSANEQPPFFKQRYLIGRYDLVDGYLDIVIDDVTERYWTIVNQVEIVPIMCMYESVVVEMPKRMRGDVFNLIFDEDAPGRSWIDHYCRFGKMKDEGNIIWGEWRLLDKNNLEAPQKIETPYIQWRADLYGWQKDTPVIRNVSIQIED